MKIHPWKYEEYSSDDSEIAKAEKIKKKKSGYGSGSELGAEEHNPYSVTRDQELKDDIKNCKQIAFAVNQDNFNIILSKSGHSAIMRKFGYDKRDFEGGWIFPSKRKIIFYSGTLGEVPKKRQRLIANAISNKLGINLRTVD